MHHDDTNVLASDIIEEYENRSDNLHSLCLVDFTLSIASKKASDVHIEPGNVKSYTVPISNINDVESNPNIIVLRNGEKYSQPCVIGFYKVFKALESLEECYLRHLQVSMPLSNKNELKQDNQSCPDTCKEDTKIQRS